MVRSRLALSALMLRIDFARRDRGCMPQLLLDGSCLYDSRNHLPAAVQRARGVFVKKTKALLLTKHPSIHLLAAAAVTSHCTITSGQIVKSARGTLSPPFPFPLPFPFSLLLPSPPSPLPCPSLPSSWK